ncbi:MAG: hypothetical protein K0T01_2672, partial [Acidimicrobiia bacterium]|nr:hypothetical protein [Acidimicrobiia bacterium]
MSALHVALVSISAAEKGQDGQHPTIDIGRWFQVQLLKHLR